MHVGTSFALVRLAILLSCLTLFFFSQRFWLRRSLSLVARLRNDEMRRAGRWALSFLAVLVVVVFADRLFAHLLPRRAPISLFVQISQLWLFASSVAFLAIKLVHGTEWVWSRATVAKTSSVAPIEAADVDIERRAFFRYAGYAAGSLPLLAGVYGFTEERLRFTVRRTDVPITGLPAALDGFRIVQMSDIHIGDFMPAGEIRRAVDMANSLSAHLAVLTGDLLTSRGDPLQSCVAELSRLRTPLGVWGCNGNHEIYANAEAEAGDLYRRFGMTLLRQRNAQFEWNGAKLNLIGVDYQRERHSLADPNAAMLPGIESLVRRDMPNILLSHNPNSFYRAAQMGIELSLAGHTHGGQIKVEIVDHSWSPARFMSDFIAGLYRLPLGSQNGHASNSYAYLYVNRGLGTIGVPARIGVEPEITLLTLRSA